MTILRTTYPRASDVRGPYSTANGRPEWKRKMGPARERGLLAVLNSELTGRSRSDRMADPILGLEGFPGPRRCGLDGRQWIRARRAIPKHAPTLMRAEPVSHLAQMPGPDHAGR